MHRSAKVAFASLLSLTPLAAQAGPTVTLTNRTGYPIDRVYVSRSTERLWGNDTVETPGLKDGERASLTLPTQQRQCQYDLRVEYHGGQAATWSGINLCDVPKISLYWNNKTRTTSAQPD